MGAVNFSIDVELVSALKEVLPFDVFVETGTFHGDTVDLVKDHFLEIYSIELSPEHFKAAGTRFDGLAHIELIYGDSSEALTDLAPKLRDRSVLYFLDAHWCVAKNTAGVYSQCPLLNELRAIKQLNSASSIIIDDARLFLAPPTAPHDISQWPSFDQVLHALQSLGSNHRLLVANDNILFVPQAVESALRQFFHDHGVDWLAAITVYSQHERLWLDLDAKEGVIQQQARSLVESQESLVEKERVIQMHATVFSESQVVVALKDRALAETHAALAQKDMALAELQVALAHKDRALAHMQAALAQKEKTLADLANSVIPAQEDAAHFWGDVSLRTTSELRSKEAVIQELAKALKAYRTAHFVLSPRESWARIIAKAKSRLRPCLGNLNQHHPIPLRQILPYRCVASVEQLPVISLVTPSYNQGHFIERTICSVLDQGYPKIEYMVQDGGSSDDTVGVLQKHEDQLAHWVSSPDSGQSQAINLGFSQSTGEIMAWLNSDDILLPGALACVADYFVRHPEVDVVYGNRLLIDEDDMEIGRWTLPGHDGKVLSWADYIPQETLFWRRSIWERVGGKIDESFRFAMDWDLLLRFRNAGAKFAHIPRFLGAFRIHAHQKTSAAISDIGHAEMGRIRERELGRQVSPDEIRMAVSTYLLRHLIFRGADRIKRILGISTR